jgi:hypothetical protein
MFAFKGLIVDAAHQRAGTGGRSGEINLAHIVRITEIV